MPDYSKAKPKPWPFESDEPPESAEVVARQVAAALADRVLCQWCVTGDHRSHPGGGPCKLLVRAAAVPVALKQKCGCVWTIGS